jgi:DNA-binding SARP family transcriptional activator
MEVTGRSLSDKETELVAYLALHPRGVTEAQIRTALWPEREAPRGTFNNLVSGTRRHLGYATDGQRLLPHCAKGLYRLHPAVACDLTTLEDATSSGASDGDMGGLVACLAALRGRPFAGCAAEWPFDDGLVARAEALIARAARRVAQAASGADAVDVAVDAVVNALAAVPDPAIEDALRALRRATAAA